MGPQSGYYVCGVRRSAQQYIPVNDLYTNEARNIAVLLGDLNGHDSKQNPITVDVLIAYGIPTTEGFAPFGVVSDIKRVYKLTFSSGLHSNSVYITEIDPSIVGLDAVGKVLIAPSTPQLMKVLDSAKLFERRMSKYKRRLARFLKNFTRTQTIALDEVAGFLQDGNGTFSEKYHNFLMKAKRPVPPQVKIEGLDFILAQLQI